MVERLFQRLGHRYVLAVFLVTRLVGFTGGMGVIYYLELTLTLPSPLREHFRLYSAIVCVFSPPSRSSWHYGRPARSTGY